MKIALINTMSRFDTYVGTVLSLHRSHAAAEKADAELQRAVKRHNGQTSYLPTIICEVDPATTKGLVHESMIIEDETCNA